MGPIIVRIIIGLIGIVCGVFLFSKVFKKHRRIDTESIAVVKDVQNLGRNDGRKVYAVRYTVLAKEQFELLETPCKKARRPGKERGVFYEKADPNHNYYFKLIGQLDRRLLLPIAIVCASLVVVASSIMPLFA